MTRPGLGAWPSENDRKPWLEERMKYKVTTGKAVF